MIYFHPFQVGQLRCWPGGSSGSCHKGRAAKSHPTEALTEEKTEGPNFESQHRGSRKAGKLKETLETCLLSIRGVNTIAACPQTFSTGISGQTFLCKISSKLPYLASWCSALPFLTFRNTRAYLHWRNTAGTFFLACEEFSLCAGTTWVKYLEWNPGSIEVNGKTPIHFSGAGISLCTVLKLELLIDC